MSKSLHSMLAAEIHLLYIAFGLMMVQWTEKCHRIFNIDYQYMLCLLTG